MAAGMYTDGDEDAPRRSKVSLGGWRVWAERDEGTRHLPGPRGALVAIKKEFSAF